MTENAPAASVVVVRTTPPASVTRIVTPESPGSPASRTPLPLTSLNFTPLIAPVVTSGRLPKRSPVTVRCAKLIVDEIVPGGAGAVWANPAGTVSFRVKTPKGTVKVKFPLASVTTDSGAPVGSLIDPVRVIVNSRETGLARVANAVSVQVAELHARNRSRQHAAEVAEDVGDRGPIGRKSDGDRVRCGNREREPLPLGFGERVRAGGDVLEEEVAVRVRHDGPGRGPSRRCRSQSDREAREARLARIPHAVGVQVLELDAPDRVGDEPVAEVQTVEVVVAGEDEVPVALRDQAARDAVVQGRGLPISEGDGLGHSERAAVVHPAHLERAVAESHAAQERTVLPLDADLDAGQPGLARVLFAVSVPVLELHARDAERLFAETLVLDAEGRRERRSRSEPVETAGSARRVEARERGQPEQIVRVPVTRVGKGSDADRETSARAGIRCRMPVRGTVGGKKDAVAHGDHPLGHGIRGQEARPGKVRHLEVVAAVVHELRERAAGGRRSRGEEDLVLVGEDVARRPRGTDCCDDSRDLCPGGQRTEQQTDCGGLNSDPIHSVPSFLRFRFSGLKKYLAPPKMACREPCKRRAPQNRLLSLPGSRRGNELRRENGPHPAVRRRRRRAAKLVPTEKEPPCARDGS